MPTRRRSRAPIEDLSYVQLEKRLALLAWLNGRFGYHTNEEALADARQTEEGFNGEGRSHLSARLQARQGVEVNATDLARYDANVRDHLRAINARRATPITLRYFQHLAALYAELYLDWYFQRPGKLLDELNLFGRRRSSLSRQRGVRADRPYVRDDLRKLAFWMATGSGKTLLLHLNYHQFLRYNAAHGEPLDSILLVTPNEGLSEQHIAEMSVSGIRCRRFDLRESGLYAGERDAVRVIEITKLTEVKKGGGSSVPVEAFEGNNLIFVDEGHKGSGGERWRGYRDALAETGFTFEYSATFGQALTAARNEELTAEYAKTIAFDYSYRYFHGDGFGKDFNILNLKETRDVPKAGEVATDDDTDRLLLGNLLAFYEQHRVFTEHKESLRAYNLARPLWVFVGGTVNAVYSRNKRKQSDVLTVVRFLHRVLRNSGNWVVDTIGRLLAGESGLERLDGRDVFDGQVRLPAWDGAVAVRVPPGHSQDSAARANQRCPAPRLRARRQWRDRLEGKRLGALLRRHHRRRRRQLPQAGGRTGTGHSDERRGRAGQLVRRHQSARHHHRSAHRRPQIHGRVELLARVQHGSSERGAEGGGADHPAIRARRAAARPRLEPEA